MNLILDIGNTRVKLGVFSTRNEYLIAVDPPSVEEELKSILRQFPKIKKALISASGKLDSNWLNFLQQNVDVHLFSSTSNIPYKSKYTTPETLGLDRKALVASAILEFPDKNNLIIDLGTCITYDFVDQNRIYYGGAISPGKKMRFRAMNNFTANLPLINIDHKDYKIMLTGDSTKNAMAIGVIEGIVMEVQGFVNQYKKKYSDLTVILCGGDANLLAGRLKNSIFANSNFQMKGLNHILEQNLTNV